MRLFVLCALCLSATAASAQPVQVTGGWIHAVPPFQTVAPGYLTLRSDKDDALTGVTIDSGGTATLRKLDGASNDGQAQGLGRLALPAGKTVTLAPGGVEMALVGDNAPLIPGSRVGVTLHFAHAAPETVELNVLSRQDGGR
jgi:copper(I)-binding protein